MNLDELNRHIADHHPNICQISVWRNDRQIYAHEWNGYRKTDCTHVM
jgi:hypothetical protein